MQSVKSDLQSIFHQYDDIQELFFQGDVSSFDINARDSHGKTLLHHACEYGLTEGVSILLANNAHVDIQDEKGYTPLHCACQNNHIHYDIRKIVIQRDPYLTLLLTQSASGSGSIVAVVTSQDKCNRTILHYACIHGDCDIVDELLKAGADPCAQDKLGNNPMHYACENGHLQCVQQLIATSQNPNGLLRIPNNDGVSPLSVKTHNGGTILHIACENHDVSVAAKLLEASADSNLTDEFGFTPLMRAVVSTSKCGITTDVVYSIITALCNSKCSLNAPYVPSKPSDTNVQYCEGSTALHMAIDGWTDNKLCVQALVDNGATLDARDVHGRTPLHIASIRGHHRLRKLLAPSPESFHFKDNDGCTPLYYACKNSHVKYIRKFIVQNPDVIGDLMKVDNNDGITPLSVRTESGGTILHVACDKGEIDLVKKLLEAGADPNVTDKFGFTPLSVRTSSGGTILHAACDEGDINLVKKLLNAGADPNVTDEFGFTPLMRAVVSTSKSGITTDVVHSIITALCNSKCSVNAKFVPSKPSNSNVQYCEGSTALHVAIDEQTVDKLCVQALVDNGAALDARDVHGRSPLHIASMRGHHFLTPLLVPSPESVHFKDNDGCTSLYYACKNSHIECIKEFLVEAPDVISLMKVANNDGTTPLSVRTVNGGTILHATCDKGDKNLVKKLLEAGADPNEPDEFGFTPLQKALVSTGKSGITNDVYCYKDSTAVDMAIDKLTDNQLCALVLVVNGAALDVRDVYGRTPLHIASMWGYHRLIKPLAPSQEAFYYKDNDGCTPLHYACKNSHLECIRRIIVQAPSVFGDLLTVANNDGTTPLSVRTGSGGTILHVACDKGNKNLVKMLLEAGADPNVTDEFGFTPLMRVVVSTSKSGYTTDVVFSIITALCNSKCSVNAPFVPTEASDSNAHYNEGSTALHMAIDEWTDDEVSVQALVDNGAALDARDVHGRTPLHIASIWGHHYLIKLLAPSPESFHFRDNDGCTPLYFACKNAHLECIREFLFQAPNVISDLMKVANNDGTTPLSVRTGSGGTILPVACDKGDINLVKMLLEAGADPNVTDEFGLTPLMRALVSTSTSGITTVKSGSVVLSIITALCNSKCNVNAPFVLSKPSDLNLHYYEGSTALHMAIDGWTDNQLCVQALVDNGASLDARDVHGRAPLHIASMRGHHHLIKLLAPLEFFYFKDNNGCTPLYYACKNSHLKCVREFMVQIPDVISDLMKAANKYGATPLSVRGHYNQTILHDACTGGVLSIVKKALESGADPNVTDKLGCTPLYYACKNSHLECVREFMVQIPDVFSDLMKVANNDGITPLSVKTERGRTILHVACEKGDFSIVKKILEAGADPNVTDNDGAIPLMSALQCYGSNVDMNLLSFLLSQDWKPDIKDNSGCTALHYSAICDDIQIPLMLISAGCDVTAFNNYGQAFSDLISKESLQLINKQLLRIDRRQIICVVGYPKCGKTTIIAAFQQAQQNRGTFQRLTARFQNTKVTVANCRTSGIDTKVITTKKLGSLIFFDFAGQSEYYVSHLAFLESALSAKGSTITFIMMVDLRCSEEDRIAQCKEWLFPIKSILKDHNMLNVILIGSHLDQVESGSTSTSSFGDTLRELKRTLGTPQMQFIDCWGMDCRQWSSKGMTNLQNYLQSTRPAHSTSVDLSQVPLGACLLFDRLKKSENPPLAITPSKIIDKLKDGRPPIPLTVKYIDNCCQDLAASGLVLYIPNREDAGESWLILEMEEILSRIHGKLFAPDSAEFPMHHKNLANQFGLVHVKELTLAFKDSPLDPEMVQKLLMAMEFCHPVDSSLMTEEILDGFFSEVSANADMNKRQPPHKLTTTERGLISNFHGNLLFFPSLVKANEESPFVPYTESDIPGDACHWVCWELSTVKPHFLHPRFQQAVFIRLACNHVQKHKSDLSTVEEHSCTVSKNAMSWSTIHGVDVCVQIMHKSTMKVLARSRPGVKVSSLMEMFSSVVSDVLTVRANHASGVDAYSVFRVMEKGTPGEHTVPVYSIIEVVQADGMYVNSRERPPKLVSLKDLFLDWEISVTLLEKMVSISKINHNPQVMTEDVSKDTHSGPVMIDEHYYESELHFSFIVGFISLFILF